MDVRKSKELSEKKVLIPITLMEAALLFELRKHPYNKITVYSSNGHPIRVVGENSIMLDENEAMQELAKAANTSYRNPN